ncbi:MAG: hypothetical protein MJ237_05695 [bacterium]|nr:hypothetical protein [bacterium]
MGMAASQSRLLSLTSRMHDIELRSQRVMADKLALATQEDEVYQKYCDAMDAKKIQVAYMDDGHRQFMDANFTSLCTYNDMMCKQYIIQNSRNGNIIVSQETFDAYDIYKNDKYSFAWAMLGFENFGDQIAGAATNAGDCIGINNSNLNDYVGPFDGDGNDLYMSGIEQIIFDNYASDKLRDLYADLDNYSSDPLLHKEKLAEFRDALYKELGSKIYKLMSYDQDMIGIDLSYPDPTVLDEYLNGDHPNWVQADCDQTFDSSEFNYYVRLWEAIDQAGGCEVMDPEFQGNNEEGTMWFSNMLQAAQINLMEYKDDKGWENLTLATSIGDNYLKEASLDNLIKKAEAEYEHEMKIINRKDEKYDNELKKLETEEEALKTERDTLKSTIKDNIEKTFNLFS